MSNSTLSVKKSLLTKPQGNVTLSISTAKEGIVGNSTILNMTLRPGDNYLPMTGIMDQTSVVKSFDPTLGVGIVELFITGTSSVRNGQHLTYYVSGFSLVFLSEKLY